MAKISERQTKDSTGGYERVFGNKELGDLITKVHATSIANGNELEKLINLYVGNRKIENLDEFLLDDTMPEGVYLANKKSIKRSNVFKTKDSEPDFLVFSRMNGTQTCHVIELKDGHVFDTKKAAAEYSNLKNFVQTNASKIPYAFLARVVGFNRDEKEDIVSGFKNKISIDEAMTGKEFCDLVEIDYTKIIEDRKSDQKENFEYFINEFLGIPEVQSFLSSLS